LPKTKLTLVALILIVAFMVAVGSVTGDNASFTVQPKQEQLITLNLSKTDRVDGSFSVVSDDNTGINFYVTDPAGNTVVQYGNTTQTNFSFIAQTTGTYTLHFDNTFSQNSSKTVALNYNVVHFIMGMPEEQFLLIVVAVVIVIAMIAFGLLSPKA
jgi:hypothetical protein